MKNIWLIKKTKKSDAAMTLLRFHEESKFDAGLFFVPVDVRAESVVITGYK